MWSPKFIHYMYLQAAKTCTESGILKFFSVDYEYLCRMHGLSGASGMT